MICYSLKFCQSPFLSPESVCRYCQRSLDTVNNSLNNDVGIRAREGSYNRQYYERNKDDLLKKNRQYYLQNRQAVLQGLRRSYSQNKSEFSDRDRSYYARNRDGFLAKERRYYVEHRDKVLEKERRYYSQNKSEMRRKWRVYYLENKAKFAEMSRQYYRRNKAKILEMTHSYYLRKHRNPHSYFPRDMPYKSWKTPEVARAFLLSLADQLHVSAPSEWYRVSHNQLAAVGGDAFSESVFTLRRSSREEIRESWRRVAICLSRI